MSALVVLSGLKSDIVRCPLSAITGREQMQQRRLRVPIGSRRKSWPSSSSRSKAYENTLFIDAPVANALEHRQAAPVAGDGLAVDEAGPRLEPRRGFQDGKRPVQSFPFRWTKTANGARG
jgi:hypothetical protein